MHGHGHGHDEEMGLYHDDYHGHNNHSTLKDVNIQAAYLHVITDTIQSIFVAIAGVIIWKYPSAQIVDPLATFVFAGLVAYTTIPLAHRVFHIFMEGVPAEISWQKLYDALLAIDGVVSIDHLHVWSLSSSSISMTCHICAKNPQVVLRDALQISKSFNIDHPTIQVEDYNSPSLRNYKPISLSRCIA